MSEASERHGHEDSGLSLTRRTALGLLGVGTVGAAMTGSAAADHGDGKNRGKNARPWNQDIDAQDHDLFNLHALEVDHVYAAARDADVIVWKDEEGIFHADNREETVASGEDVLEVTQSAVDSLTDGRDWMEKVAVVSPSTVGPVHGDGDIGEYDPSDQFAGIELPSYTALDVPARMRVEDEGDQAMVIPVMAADAEHVEIPNLHVVGNPRFGMFLQSVRNLRLGNISIEMTGSDPRGNIGVRIDGFAHGRGEDTVRCKDVQVDTVYVENSGGHAFETYAVDRIQVGDVIANGVESGCGVLLNDTTDATVNSVVGKEIDPGGGYAGFRVANGTHDVTCDQVVVRGGARGVFGVSGSHNITVGEVNISEMDVCGIFIEDNQNFTVEGGVVANCDGEAVRIHSRDDFGHDPTNGVTISNLRTYDDREEGEREQSYGIHVSGGQTSNVRIVNCDVREGGTEENIRVAADETILENNHGGGLDLGTVTLEGGADPAATVQGVSSFEYQQPSLRADPVDATGATFAYDHYFLWNDGRGEWDLVFEWKHDPSRDVDVQYVVDNPRANLGTGDAGQEIDLVDDLEPGTYRITAQLNGDDIVMSVDDEDGLTDGANVYNETIGEATNQQWVVTEPEDGVYRIAAAGDENLVLEAADGGTDTGTNLELGTWEDADYQKFAAVPRSEEAYTLEPTHADLAADVWEVDPEPGADIRHWNPSGGNNQLFKFVESDS
ncbi:RICIN domain-containing protein [Halopiger xanaduensis]|uniref:RICIN domain-containing protein n=1 Tax=Halopiger xanaduensis TaxID=387343 RepID=UPI001FDFC279|nr:RICIN domain-containing protein [Halopiger xanaduensis]